MWIVLFHILSSFHCLGFHVIIILCSTPGSTLPPCYLDNQVIADGYQGLSLLSLGQGQAAEFLQPVLVSPFQPPSIISLTPRLNSFQENFNLFPGLRLPEQMRFSGAISSESLPYPGVNLWNSSQSLWSFFFFLFSYIQGGSKVFHSPGQNETSFSFVLYDWTHFRRAHAPHPTLLSEL